jgi:hypothetical protein
MRNFAALLVVGWVLTGAGQAVASDRDDALEILGQAIKAQGGEEALAKAAQLTRKGSGTLAVFDKDFAFTDELTVSLPERFRLSVDLMVEKQNVKAVLVINGEMGWRDNGGAVEELTKELLAELQEEAYAQWVSLLVPLAKDTDFNLAPLPKTKVNDRPAVGIKVTRKARPDISLYFDTENKLLVKVSRKGKEAGLDAFKEDYFSDYKEVDGVRLPFHILRMLDQKKFHDLKVASYKFLGKADDKVFSKP